MGGLRLDRDRGLTEAAAWLWTIRVRYQFLAVYRPCSFLSATVGFLRMNHGRG